MMRSQTIRIPIFCVAFSSLGAAPPNEPEVQKKAPREALVPPAVTGFVHDSAGAPVAGAQVILRVREGEELATLSTASDGFFRLEQPLPYWLIDQEILCIVQAPNLGFGQGVHRLTGGLNTIDVKLLGLQLPRPPATGYVRGLAAELSSGRPARYVVVRLLVRGAEIARTTSDGQGLFALPYDEARFKGETARLEFSGERFAPLVTKIVLEQQTAETIFKLPPRHGTVFDTFFPAILFQPEGWVFAKGSENQLLAVTFADQYFSSVQLNIGGMAQRARPGGGSWVAEVPLETGAAEGDVVVKLVQRLEGEELGIRQMLVDAIRSAVVASSTSTLSCGESESCGLDAIVLNAVHELPQPNSFPVARAPVDPAIWKVGSNVLEPELRALLQETLRFELAAGTTVIGSDAGWEIREPDVAEPIAYLFPEDAQQTWAVICVPAQIVFQADGRFERSIRELSTQILSLRRTRGDERLAETIAAAASDWELAIEIPARPRERRIWRVPLGITMSWAPSVDANNAAFIGAAIRFFPWGTSGFTFSTIDRLFASYLDPSYKTRPISVGFSVHAGARVIGGGTNSFTYFATGATTDVQLAILPLFTFSGGFFFQPHQDVWGGLLGFGTDWLTL